MDSAEKFTKRNSSMGSGGTPEKGGAVGRKNIDHVDDDDSPYVTHGPSVDKDDSDSSRGWDDISVYNAKKVTLMTVILHVVSCMMN